MIAPLNKRFLAIERSRHILVHLLGHFADECGNIGSSNVVSRARVSTLCLQVSYEVPALRLCAGMFENPEYLSHMSYVGCVYDIRMGSEAAREIERLQEMFVTDSESGKLRVGAFFFETSEKRVSEAMMFQLAAQDERSPSETARLIFEALRRLGLRDTLELVHKGHLKNMKMPT